MAYILLCSLPIPAHEIYTPSSNSRDLDQESMAPKPTPLILYYIPPSVWHIPLSFFFLPFLSLHHLRILPICLLVILYVASRHILDNLPPLPQNWYKQYYFLIAKISRNETSYNTQNWSPLGLTG